MAITRTALIDDDGSGTTGTVFNNAWLQALFDTLDAAITAAWVVPTFAAANFVPSTGTWVVDAGDIGTFQWRRQGNTVQVNFEINTSTITGAPTILYIASAAYGGVVAKRAAAVRLAYLLNGTEQAGILQIVGGGTALQIGKADGSAFAASTNNTFVWGQITFEVN